MGAERSSLSFRSRPLGAIVDAAAPRHPPGRIALISDTHGLLRPEAQAFLEGSSLIIHGGDIGRGSVLESLRRIAPVVAVRGNNDTESGDLHLGETEFVRIGDALVFVIHDRSRIDVDLRALGVRVVISGHSHQASVDEIGAILFVNPGSAGPRRFKLPITVGELTFRGTAAVARVCELTIAKKA